MSVCKRRGCYVGRLSQRPVWCCTRYRRHHPRHQWHLPQRVDVPMRTSTVFCRMSRWTSRMMFYMLYETSYWTCIGNSVEDTTCTTGLGFTVTHTYSHWIDIIHRNIRVQSFISIDCEQNIVLNVHKPYTYAHDGNTCVYCRSTNCMNDLHDKIAAVHYRSLTHSWRLCAPHLETLHTANCSALAPMPSTRYLCICGPVKYHRPSS